MKVQLFSLIDRLIGSSYIDRSIISYKNYNFINFSCKYIL